MEQIILLALFGIVSSVIQAVIKKNNQQKQPTMNTHDVKPKIQTTYKTINIPNTSGIGEILKKSTAPVQNSRLEIPNINMEPEIFKKETPSEVLTDRVITELKDETVSSSGYILSEDITFSELQRSIIMAEVLGKPKALKKAIR